MAAYRELIFAGSRAEVEAVLRGIAPPVDALFSEEIGVHAEGAGERLLERLHLEPATTHVILREEEAARVGAAHPPGLRAVRAIREASFAYRFRAYSRGDADAIRAALGALPAGATLIEEEASEAEDASARGPELYAPVHEYVFAGRGWVRGELAAVLAARRALGEAAMLEADEIRLDVGAR